jgi:serine/threonine-protein kinase
MPAQPGQMLSHYRLIDKIGEGGMGVVWKAEDTTLRRPVALKFLTGESYLKPLHRARFLREARVAAALNHPHVCVIHEVAKIAPGEEDVFKGEIPLEVGTLFIAMEWIEGRTLEQVLHKSKPPSLEWILDVAVQVVEALRAAHEKNIVHRDLKPANVMLAGDDRVKILDFGLAKPLDPPKTDDEVMTAAETASAELTRTGSVLGTVAYMSPEQARGAAVDSRSDIFSFGVMLYEMAAGRCPFRGESPTSTLAKILEAEPEPIDEARPDLPADLVRIIRRCLRKRPDDRYNDTRDLLVALKDLRHETDSVKVRQATSDTSAEQQPSIAVLPFTNLSADPEQEYFCDGTAEEIIGALAHVQGLRVVARTSSFAFKGRSKDIREIGKQLDVTSVLEGSVRRVGDRLRITAQLINVADGYYLWSERFDRRLEDVFAIQDEIALAIVDSLKVRLLAREKAILVRRHTDNLEAHNAYLVGLFEWNKMSPEGFVRCQELFQEAIRLDPEFAPAYARLADSFTSVTWWSDQPSTEALARALPLVEKALALDPDLAHAHSVVGHTNSFFQRDWVAGERSLRRAVELAPNDALAQTYLALLLVMAARGTEASERARMALRLDPFSPTNNVWAGTVLLFSGHAEEGISVIERQVTMTPHLWMPSFWLTVALASGGRFAEARVAGEKALELSGGISLTLCIMAMIYYRLGDQRSGDALFASLQQRARTGYVAPMFLTWVHLSRGEPETALRCASEALAAKDPWVSPHRLMCPSIVPADPLVDDLLASAFP